MQRYFFRLSYVGTSFRSCVTQREHFPANQTVTGTVEDAFKRLPIKNYSPIILSSRTDAGVHAFNNAGQIDLEWKSRNSLPIPNITDSLNRYFYRNNIPIRISGICKVSNTFSARFCAKQRTYLYRLGILKPGKDPLLNPSPISEWGRCYILNNSNFNVELVEEAVKLFPGVHNFSSFAKAKAIVYKSPFRLVHSCSIQKGQPLTNSCFDPQIENFDFLNFTVEGASFLTQQVRRMVTSLLAVAQGRLSTKQLEQMLLHPSPNYVLQPPLVPAYGLYLVDVKYDPADFSLNRNRNHLIQLTRLLQIYATALKQQS